MFPLTHLQIVLIMGFANLLGDGVSMAFGEFISGDAEQKYASMEQQRERWEFENDPEGEKREMVDLYMAKGFDKEDAENVINTMVKCVAASLHCSDFSSLISTSELNINCRHHNPKGLKRAHTHTHTHTHTHNHSLTLSLATA